MASHCTLADAIEMLKAHPNTVCEINIPANIGRTRYGYNVIVDAARFMEILKDLEQKLSRQHRYNHAFNDAGYDSPDKIQIVWHEEGYEEDDFRLLMLNSKDIDDPANFRSR